jgi:Concanavalin A-like lectin/glucanases superfamily
MGIHFIKLIVRGNFAMRRRVPAVALAAAATVVLFAASAQAAPVAVGLWHLNEARGATVARDSTSPANNGRISGAVTTGIAGHFGTAYHFSGGLVTVPDSSALDPGRRPFTVSMFLRVPASLSIGDYNVLQKGRATTAGGQYKVEIGGAEQRGVGKPRCSFVDSSRKAVVVKASSTDIADGQWHLVICRRSASSVSISVDGSVKATTSITLGSIANASPFLFGGKGVGLHSYIGDMDEVSLRIG